MAEQNKQILVIVSISSLIFLTFSAEAICVPKNSNTLEIHSHSPAPSPSTQSPPHVSARPPRPSTQSPPHASSLPHPPAAAATEPTPFNISPSVRAVCEKTDYPSLCISSLAPFLANRDNPAAILEMAIKAAVNYTSAALAKAKVLSSDPSTSTTAMAYIADCLELYADAIDNFNAAASAIPSGDIGLMNSMLSAAITDFSTCEDGFAEASEDSPFKEMDSKLSNMGSNCLAIAALLPLK